MVKKLLVTISLFILVLIGAFDVAAQVDLYVYNGDYESVANATVSIELTGSGTPIETRTTDSFGVASFTGAFSGMTYDVRVTKNGQMGNFDEVVPTFIDTASSSFEYVYLLGYPPLDQLDLTIYDGTFSYVDGATVTILFGTTPIEQSMTDSFGTAGFSFSTPLDADVNYDIRVELGTFSETVPLQIKNSFHDVNLTGAPSGTLMIDYLYFSVTNSSLIGAEGVYVDLYDEFDFLVFSCLTDENGDCFEITPLSPLLEGEYRVELVPWATSQPLLPTTRYLTIDETTAVFNNGFYEVTDSYVIDEATRSIKVEVYEAIAGTSTPDLTKPVEDVNVDAYPADPESPPLTSGITGSNGVAYLPISETTSGFYNINIFSPNGVNDVQPITIEQGTSDVVVQFALNLGDADIVIALENSSGQALVAQESQFDPERSDIFVNCFLEFETTNPEEFPTGAILNADANVPIGQSGTTLKVSGGYTYRCSAFNEATGEPISQQTVVAVTGVPQSVTLRAVEKDASVTIRLLDDATGALIVGPQFYVDAFTDYSSNSGGSVIDDFDFGDTVDGTVTLQLVAGQDYVGFANPDLKTLDENGFPTISLGDYLPSSEVHFTASNNLIVEIRLDKYDAKVKVCFKNGDTNQPIANGFIELDSPSSSTEPPPVGGEPPVGGAIDFTDAVFLQGTTDTTGCTEVAVKSGRYYNVRGFSPESFESEEPSGGEEFSDYQLTRLTTELLVFPKAGDELNLELVERSPNYTFHMDIDPSSIGGASDLSAFEFAGCLIQRPDGTTGYTIRSNANTLRISVLHRIENKSVSVSKMPTFSYACIATDDPETGQVSGKFYYTTGTVKPTPNTDQGAFTVVFPKPLPKYAPVTESVPRTSKITKNLPGAIGAVTVPEFGIERREIQGTNSIRFSTPNSVPGLKNQVLKSIIEIDPLGATGEKVRNTAQKLRICFTIDKETIIAAGGIENIQVFKVKDSSNSVAILTATRTLNDDGSGEICVLSDQFSVFGTLLDVAKQLQSTTARNLRFSKPKQVKIGGGKKRGKKSKGKKVNRWRIKFDYEADDAVTATTQFVFKYAFIKNRKQCANVTNDQLTESVAIDGNIPFDITATNPKQQALCGTIEVVGGRTSDPSFKGRTKR